MRPVWQVSVLGFGHLLVDMVSSVLFLRFAVDLGGLALGYFPLMVIYIGLAFAIQPLLGLFVDRLNYRHQTIYSCLLSAVSCLLFFYSPLPAVCLACFANSLYHVAAGAAILRLDPGKSFYPGLFVAPGTWGIFLSQILARQPVFPFWANFLPMLAFTLLAATMPFPKTSHAAPSVRKIDKKTLALFLFCVVVLVRSLGGFTVAFPWKSSLPLLVLLTLAVFLGKAFGGLIADRFGWRATGIISLLVSAPLITLASTWPALAIPGMFLFNFTMPITLAAANRLFPHRPGFVFGLVTFVVSLGTFPLLTRTVSLFSAPVLLLTVLLSALPLLIGLNILPSKSYTGN